MSNKKKSQEDLLEERKMELRAELQNSFKQWQQLYLYGGSDPFYEDGYNLNLVRNHIIYAKHKCVEELPEGTYPDEFFQETPPEVDDHYMARKDEIRSHASVSLKRYQADANYIFLVQNLNKLDEKQKKECCIGAVLGYVSGLKEAITQNDFICMRRHEYAENYMDSFVRCRKNMENYIRKIQTEKILPEGQLSIFDIFDFV